MDVKRNIKYAQKLLGIDQLNKQQIESINAVLEGMDVISIAPTGAGKSAIYQVLANLYNGLSIIIEPTISLIYDQVQKLKSLNISAERIDSSMTAKERSIVWEEVKNGNLKMLFITPERLSDQKFADAVKEIKISMIAIDEAHCITVWGYGFRSAYLGIGGYIDSLAERPAVVALTATAPEKMRMDISQLLALQNPKILVSSLYRPNIQYIKRAFTSDHEKLKVLKNLLKKHTSGSCIVYCNTKKMTDSVYEKILEWYPDDVTKCHSNLKSVSRKANELVFMSGEKRIMVATSAFGMGIDQQNVDLVIHFNLPLSLIDYYQQSGRAGRAGQKSKCVLLYCENDYIVNMMLLENIQDESARKDAFQALDRMKEYADSSSCLTQQILCELGEKKEKPCGRCTNCQKQRRKEK